MTGSEFTQWLDRMGWPDSKLASMLEISRNSVAKYKADGSPVAIDYACEALERRQQMKTREGAWMQIKAIVNDAMVIDRKTKVASFDDLADSFSGLLASLQERSPNAAVGDCQFLIQATDDPVQAMFE